MLDDEHLKLKSALLEVAETGKANFRFTCNQNLILSDISEQDRQEIAAILERYGVIAHTENATVIRKNAMACVALNTCPLALAEGQRYLPVLLSKIEPLFEKHGLNGQEVVIRMTGCPNGCARSYLAEIGFIGTALGKYNMYLGADQLGYRLNKLYKESLEEEQILSTLDGLLELYASERKAGEGFGDFSIRKGWVG